MVESVSGACERELEVRQACAELCERLRAGDTCRSEQILDTVPWLAADADLALEVIYTEFTTREQLGQQPDPSELYARFPQWRARLERLMQVHLTFAEGLVSTSPALSRPIPGFHIVRPIGSGSMGTVYLAEQILVKRQVALKVLHAHISQQRAVVERFHREAVVLGMLSHPNIASIYASGVENGVHFLAMQYCQGQSLQTLWEEQLGRVDSEDCAAAQDVGQATTSHSVCTEPPDRKETPVSGPRASSPSTATGSYADGTCHNGRGADQAARTGSPPWHGAGPPSTPDSHWYDFVLRTMIRIADAISYAHSHGVLHRDLKPSNVIVNWSSGDVWVVDFGLAKTLMSDEQTLTAGPVGTPAYSSPEQLAGEQVDGRSDVYSLGVLLKRLLSRSSVPESATGWIPDANEPVRSIVRRATEKEPQLRYPSVDAFRRDLEALADGRAPRVACAGFVRRLALRARRLKLLLAAAAVLVMVTAGVGYLYYAERAKTDQAVYVRMVENAIMKLHLGQSLASPDARDEWFLKHFVDIKAVEFAEGPNPLEEALVELDRAVARLPRRPEAQYYRARALLELACVEEATEQLDRTMAGHPDFLPAVILRRQLSDQEGQAGVSGRRRGVGGDGRESPLAVPPDGPRQPGRGAHAVYDTAWSQGWTDARAAMRQGRWLDAADAFSRLLESDFEEPFIGCFLECYLGRGAAYLRASRYASAAEDFAVVSSRWPRAIEPALLIGKAYQLSGNEERAEQVFRQTWSRAVQPDLAALWIAGVYQSHRHPLQAVAWMDRVQDEHLRGLGMVAILTSHGQAAEAEKKARQLLEKFGPRASTYDQLAESLLTQRKFTEAAAAAQEAIRLDPGLAYAYLRLGNALIEMGDVAAGMRSFRTTRQLRPKDPVICVHIALRLHSAGKYEKAANFCLQAIRLNPRLVDAHYVLGHVYVALQRPHEAIERFREVIRLDPRVAHAHQDLAGLYARLQRWPESFDECLTALELDPGARSPAEILMEASRTDGPHWSCDGTRKDVEWFHQSGGGGTRLIEVLERLTRSHEDHRLLSVLAMAYFHRPPPSGHPKSLDLACQAVEAPDGDLPETLDVFQHVIGTLSLNGPAPLHPFEFLLHPPPLAAVDTVLERHPICDPDQLARICSRFTTLSQAEETGRRVAYLEARVHQLAGRYPQAALRFQTLIDHDPTRPEPVLHLVQCLRARGDSAGEQQLRRQITPRGNSRLTATQRRAEHNGRHHDVDPDHDSGVRHGTRSVSAMQAPRVDERRIVQWDFDGNLNPTVGTRPVLPGAAQPAVAPEICFEPFPMADGMAQAARFSRGTMFQLDHGFALDNSAILHPFTLILDLRLSLESDSYGTILQTDPTNQNDGDWSAHPTRGLGEQRYGGVIRPDTWYRLALVVDPVDMTVDSYIDGRRVGSLKRDDYATESFILRPSILLFADQDGETSSGWINSVQLRNYAMTSAEIAALAGPQAAGIPQTDP